MSKVFVISYSDRILPEYAKSIDEVELICRNYLQNERNLICESIRYDQNSGECTAKASPKDSTGQSSATIRFKVTSVTCLIREETLQCVVKKSRGPGQVYLEPLDTPQKGFWLSNSRDFGNLKLTEGMQIEVTTKGGSKASRICPMKQE